MAYNILIPVVSATAGDNADGSLIGSALESNFAGAFTDVRLAAAVTAYRKDVAGSSFTFADLSTPLNEDTVSDAAPFGTNAQMSAGDKFYISCSNVIKALYFQVATAGVWSGTMAFKCSTDGLTANHTITAVVDDSNGFRAGTGVYKLTPTLPANIVAFSPVPGDVPSMRWIVFEPSVTSVTTAPVLTRAWLEHEDGSITYINLSSNINSDLITDGSGHPPNFFPTVGSSTFYAFADKPKGMVRKVFQRAADVRTRVIEYLASDNTWKTLTGWTDPSNDFKNGPASQTDMTITGITAANPCVITALVNHGRSVNDQVHITAVVGMTAINGKDLKVTAVTANTMTVNLDSSGYTAYTSGGTASLFIEYNVNIVAPSDWASKSQTFTTSSGDVTVAGYYLRERTTAVSTIGPAQIVRSNVRAKQFGNANTAGIASPFALTLKGVTIMEPLSESGSGAVSIQISNLTNGESTTFEIPASPTYPVNVDFTDLVLAANERLGMFYVSGSKTLTSVSVIIHI